MPVEFLTSEGCFITELHNTAADPSVSVARARVERGVTTRWHRVHGVIERYVVLEGRGRVEVGEEPARDVGPGDVVTIPASARQRIENVGDGDLIFLAVCTPRFTPDAYEEI